MDAREVDYKLLQLLNNLPYFSNIGTCLLIRLADHAAQLNGFRSTRYVNDNSWKDVDENYIELVNRLNYNIYEATNYLKNDHVYSDFIFSLTESELDDLLEDTLFNMTILGTHNVFHESFFRE